MTDTPFEGGEYQPLITITPGQRHDAITHICRYAHDRFDAWLLLQALGLTPYREGNRQ